MDIEYAVRDLISAGDKMLRWVEKTHYGTSDLAVGDDDLSVAYRRFRAVLEHTERELNKAQLGEKE